MTVLKMKTDNLHNSEKLASLYLKESDCKRVIAKIIHKNSLKSFQVSYDKYQLEATLSSSCIIEPEHDDVIELLLSSDKAYIISVLEKANHNSPKYRLQGNVILGTPDSDISITSNKAEIKSSNILLDSQNALNITAENTQIQATNFLDVSAENRETNIKGLDLHTAETISQKSSQINVTSDKFNINA